MAYMVRNQDDLDVQLEQAQDKLVVIDFFANWCGPCKVIAPKLEELAQQYSDRVVVLKVNVDDNEDITVEYNITSMPTFVFIKGGVVLEFLVGGNSDKLAKFMEKFTSDVEEAGDPSAGSGSAPAPNPEEEVKAVDPSASSASIGGVPGTDQERPLPEEAAALEN